MTAPRILAFSGSLRVESLNQRILLIAAEGASTAGAAVEIIKLKDFDLPIYDGDQEASSGLPAGAIALQERMSFFVQPTEEVYEGMVIGENSRADDMDVNITKEKKLTNMRSSTSDSFESMTPPRVLTLEESLEFARDDECVEVTPEKVRIRKVVLDQTERARAASRLKRQDANA